MRGLAPIATLIGAFRGNAVFRRSVLQGDLARDRGQWSAAVEHYQRALRVKPGKLAIGVQLGHALKELGRYEEAESRYLEYLDTAPADADIYLQLGHLYLVIGRASQAKHMYAQALELAGTGQVALDARLGLLSCNSDGLFERRQHVHQLIGSRKFPLVERELARLINEEGCDDLCLVYANVCKELGMYDTAMAYYRRHISFAERLSPMLAGDAWTNLARVEGLSGNPASAIRTLVTASQYGQGERKQAEIAVLQNSLAEITTSLSLSP